MTNIGIKKQIYLDLQNFENLTGNIDFFYYDDATGALFLKDDKASGNLSLYSLEKDKTYKISFELVDNIYNSNFSGELELYCGAQYELIGNSQVYRGHLETGTGIHSFNMKCLYTNLFNINTNFNKGIKWIKIEELEYTLLDLFDGGITLNLQINDIKNFGSKFSNYSEDFLLPGTSNNNKLFGYVDDINIINKFNRDKRIKAVICNDYNILFDGNLQYLETININGKIEHKVTFFTDNLSLINLVGNRKLNELDLSDADHINSNDTIVNSWTSTDMNFVYPFIDYGRGAYGWSGGMWDNFNSSYKYGSWSNTVFNSSFLSNNYKEAGLTAMDLLPALKFNYIFNKLFSTYGFSFDIKGIPNEVLNALILPFANDENIFNSTSVEHHTLLCHYNDTIRPGQTDYFYSKLRRLNTHWGQELFFPHTANIIDDEYQSTQSLHDDPNYAFFNPMGDPLVYNVQNKLRVPTPYLYYSDVDYSNSSSYMSPSPSLSSYHKSTPHGTYLVKKPGKYYIYYDLTIITGCNGSNERRLEVGGVRLKSGSWWYNSYVDNQPLFTPGLAVPLTSSINNTLGTICITEDGDINNEILGGNINLFGHTEGFYNGIEYRANGSYIGNSVYQVAIFEDCKPGDLIFLSYNWNIDTVMIADSYVDFKFTNIKVKYNGYAHSKSIKAKNILDPNYLQKDLISDFIKMFNIYAFQDENDSKKINLWTRDYFYTNSSSTLDWTYKVDYNKEIINTTPKQFQSQKTNLLYSIDDKLKGNITYRNWYGTEVPNYSEKQLLFDSDFSNDKYELKLKFQNVPMFNGWGGNGEFLSSGHTCFIYSAIRPDVQTGEYTTNITKQGQRIMLYKYTNIPPYYGNTTSYNNYHRFRFNYTYYNSYPYAGHILDVLHQYSGVNYDINFSTDKNKGLIDTATITPNNLFNLYYSKYFNDINDKDANLVNMKIKLNFNDICSLKMNEKIFINGTFYLINKIEYNTNDKELSNVELLKMISNYNLEYTELPVLINVIPDGRIPETLTIASQQTNNILNNVVRSTSGETISVVGSNNQIYTNTYNIIIQGNNNIINSGLSNIIIYGDNINALYSNATYQNGTITINGVTMLYNNICEGGLNEVQNNFGIDVTTVKNGGYNTNREANSIRAKNLTDGSI